MAVEHKIQFSEESIVIYTAFKEQIHRPKSVLYPLCGLDASPAKVFDNVTFVDSEVEPGSEGIVRKLQDAWLHAIKCDIRDYKPEEEHDLLILLNPTIPPGWATAHLARGGYILANNYHGTATVMHENPDKYSLWGVIDLVEKGVMGRGLRAAVSRNLEGLFEPVSGEEELRRLRPDYYDFLLKTFRAEAMNPPGFNLNRPFGEIWADWRERMREGMSSKRVADTYVFVKK